MPARKLRRHERWLAFSLGIVWFGGGAAGLVLGLSRAGGAVVAIGVFGMAYGIVWFGVAARARLFEPGAWLRSRRAPE